MRIAIIGQSIFASSVYNLLIENGQQVVGVFTITDIDGKEDPLATAAARDNVPVFKIKRWRLKSKIIPDIFEKYKSVQADLNVLPYCTQFIPMEVINYPKYQSICYHPSLLPKHRGASSINWTIIEGDDKAGFSIFWPDDGLDTGPILLQESCPLEEDDTVISVYNRFLFPAGIKAIAKSVNLIEQNKAPKIVQPKEGASYDPMLNKEELCEIKFDQLTGQQLHNFIRGMDKVPGAWLMLDDQKYKVFGSKLFKESSLPLIKLKVNVGGMSKPGLICNDGLILFGTDEKAVLVNKLQNEKGKMIRASSYGQEEMTTEVEISEEEQKYVKLIESIWSEILKMEVNSETDFFKSGAGSMDVTRLIETLKDECEINLHSEDVYMFTTLSEFIKVCVLKSRDKSFKPNLTFKSFTLKANKLEITLPIQLFINNNFVDSSTKNLFSVINPSDETVITQVHSASPQDVDLAVRAAQAAFETGEWGKMNARDRASLMYKLADLMEERKEELATIESIDSGAVYTLALKTHIGMSIETWRYFAGWCDKIQGSTIPINNSRPNKNLTFTKKEPIGVVGLITPWNYPLMMVSWKMASCLAAGNTVVLKPTQNCPLTALKLAELSFYAGFPPGVINILPGDGKMCGQAIAEHPLVRKLGFTGSTPTGKEIMKACAISNLKKVSLELGGKSPLIIFKDCDFTKAVRNALSSVFFNKGENCIAAGRLFVESSIYDKFVSSVIDEIKKMVIGDPLNRATNHGPQNNLAHLEKLINYCQIGVKEGAKLMCGGKRLDMPGYYFEPTVFTEVTDDMYIAKEESFGPIMIISKFETLDEVIERANKTEYGLASGVFTQNISKALMVSDRIQAGTCFVNCYNKTDVAAPFGGFKQSGFGKDLGEAALNEYLKIKTVTIEY